MWDVSSKIRRFSFFWSANMLSRHLFDVCGYCVLSERNSLFNCLPVHVLRSMRFAMPSVRVYSHTDSAIYRILFPILQVALGWMSYDCDEISVARHPNCPNLRLRRLWKQESNNIEGIFNRSAFDDLYNGFSSTLHIPMSRVPSGDPSVSWLPEPGDPAVPDAVVEPGEIPGKAEPGGHICAGDGHGKPL